MILSGSEDGFVYGWDLNSQRLQIKLPIVAKKQVKDEEPLQSHVPLKMLKHASTEFLDSPDREELQL